MNFILILVFVALILKDTCASFGFDDPYVFRALSQGICLLATLFLFMTRIKELGLNKYCLLFLYLVGMGISSLLSESALYSSLQTLSLAVCLLFFVAYHELVKGVDSRKGMPLVIRILLLLMVLSLVLISVSPSTAFYYNPFEGYHRFRGVFTNPEEMAATAGMVWGALAFGRSMEISRPIRATGMLISFVCLLMTACRTYMIAWLFATFVVLLRSGPSYWRFWKVLLLFFVVTAGASILLIDVTSSAPTIRKYLRIDSMVNMSGRISIWQEALARIKERPFFGYGLAASDDAFKKRGEITVGGSEPANRATMHNGYVQSLLDSGLIGLTLYLLVNVKALYNLFVYYNKELASALYAAVFVDVANVGQSLLFTAASYVCLLGWFYILAGLSISREKANSPQQACGDLFVIERAYQCERSAGR